MASITDQIRTRAGGNTGVSGAMDPTNYGNFGRLRTDVPPQKASLPMGGADRTANLTGAGADPFAYTGGSLLTPWTRPFEYKAPAEAPESGEGGPAAPAPPGFGFGDLSYSFRDPGSYQAPTAYTGPGTFRGGRVTAGGPFQSGVPDYAAPQYTAGQLAMPGRFTPGTSALTLDRFNGGTPFVPPNLSEDPGYQFRLAEGQKALERSAAARGTLRGGGTLQALTDYGQNAASQEYAAAYGRRFAEHQDANQMALASYDRNTAAQVLENQTAYGRETDAYDRNVANELAYFQANEGARQFGADFGFRSGLAANESAYGRRAGEYDRGEAARRWEAETNYARDASEFDRNAANARDVYALNADTGLKAYQADTAAAAAMGNLGWNVASGTWDRNFQNYSTAFNIDEARRMQAAAMAGGGGGGGGDDYARQLQQYKMEYDIFQNNQANQYARLMGLASLGAGTAGQTGQYGGNAAMMAGNAAAGGQMGSANAWAQGLGSAANAGLTAAMYAGMTPRTLTSGVPVDLYGRA